MSAMHLNIRFHDPNSTKDTYKTVSKVFTKVYMQKVRKKVSAMPDEQFIAINTKIVSISGKRAEEDVSA